MKKRDWKVASIAVGATLAVVLLIALILRMCSFQIVYDPKVITEWDAVAGVAAWVGVIFSSGLSAVAIWFAIQVPKKIAERQDKISLFEKRFECYLAYDNILEFAAVIKKENNASEIENAIKFIMHLQNRICNDIEVDVLPYFENLENRVATFDFLFPNCKSRVLQDAIGAIENLIISTFEREEGNDALTDEDIKERDVFLELTKEFKSKYHKLIQETLNI